MIKWLVKNRSSRFSVLLDSADDEKSALDFAKKVLAPSTVVFEEKRKPNLRRFLYPIVLGIAFCCLALSAMQNVSMSRTNTEVQAKLDESNAELKECANAQQQVAQTLGSSNTADLANRLKGLSPNDLATVTRTIKGEQGSDVLLAMIQPSPRGDRSSTSRRKFPPNVLNSFAARLMNSVDFSIQSPISGLLSAVEFDYVLRQAATYTGSSTSRGGDSSSRANISINAPNSFSAGAMNSVDFSIQSPVPGFLSIVEFDFELKQATSYTSSDNGSPIQVKPMEIVEVSRLPFRRDSTFYLSLITNVPVEKTSFDINQVPPVQSFKHPESLAKKTIEAITSNTAVQVNLLAVGHCRLGQKGVLLLKTDDLVEGELEKISALEQKRKFGEAAARLRTLREELVKSNRREWQHDELQVRVKELEEFAKFLQEESQAVRLTTILDDIERERKSYGGGDVKNALAIRRETHRDIREFLGERHSYYASSLGDLSFLCLVNGKGNEAIEYREKSLTGYSTLFGEKHPSVAKQYLHLGDLKRQSGKLDSAFGDYKLAAETLGSTYGKGHVDYATCLNMLGLVFKSKGDLKKAEVNYLTAKAIFEKSDVSKRELANIHNNLSVLYRQTNDYVRAKRHITKSLELYRQIYSAEHFQIAQVYNNYGDLCLALGDIELAKKYFTEAKENWRATTGEESPGYAQAVFNLAKCAMDESKPREAFVNYQLAKSILTDLGRDPRELAVTLSGLGKASLQLKKYENALSYFSEFSEQIGNLKGRDHREYALAQLNLAQAHQQSGNFLKAGTYFESALSILDKSKSANARDVASTKASYASLRFAEGNTEKAIEALTSSLASYEDMLSRSFDGLSTRQRIVLTKSLRSQLDSYLSFQLASDNPNLQEIYSKILFWKGLVARHSLLNDTNENEQYGRLAKLKSEYAGKVLFGASEQEVVDGLAEEIESLEAELAEVNSVFARKFTRQINQQEIEKSLPGNGVFIDLYVFDRTTQTQESIPTIIAFLLARDSELQCVTLGNAKDIEQSISAWTNEISTSDSIDEINVLGERVRKLIWDPVAKKIERRSFVFVCPDGRASLLPFAALPTNKGYLGQEVSFAFANTASDMIHAADREFVSMNALVLGGIDYDGDSQRGLDDIASRGKLPYRLAFNSPFKPLPRTELEAKEIASLFQEHSVVANHFSGKTVTEEFVRDKLKQRPHFLHFATHGFYESRLDAQSNFKNVNSDKFQSRNPMLFSGVVFSGVNETISTGHLQNGYDGVLTADELSSLDLNETLLATCSACDSGLGRIERNEGVLGLQRAFRMAGVDSTLTSLWAVDDKATQELMVEFYKRVLTNDESFPVALASAQAKIINGTGLSKHPRFWAPWVVHVGPIQASKIGSK